MVELDVLLRKHGLRKTVFRTEMLLLFINSRSSLSVEDIKSQVRSTNDKVTIYRALKAFEKTGLIHQVPDKGNITRYSLCHSECTDKGHIHNHAHFICTSCEETFCIEDMEVPNAITPHGYMVERSKLTLEGECPMCHTETKENNCSYNQ